MFGRNLIIILLRAHSLEVVISGESQPTPLILPTTIVDNLEILDKDALYALIATWAKARTYQNSEIIWLLSPEVCFEQFLADSDKEHWDTLTVQFLDSVPFENVVSRVYTPLEGRRIVATNKDLLAGLIQGFAIHGYNTRIILPLTIVTKDHELSPSIIKQVLATHATLAKDAFEVPTLAHLPTPSSTIVSAPPPKSQLPLLLGVFGVLLVILVVVIVLNQ